MRKLRISFSLAAALLTTFLNILGKFMFARTIDVLETFPLTSADQFRIMHGHDECS